MLRPYKEQQCVPRFTVLRWNCSNLSIYEILIFIFGRLYLCKVVWNLLFVTISALFCLVYDVYRFWMSLLRYTFSFHLVCVHQVSLTITHCVRVVRPRRGRRERLRLLYRYLIVLLNHYAAFCCVWPLHERNFPIRTTVFLPNYCGAKTSFSAIWY